ncbi:MAG TPA: hypothetical protein VNO43_09280 [Candidatus Eisenbacteria bacterium]|nr:hypothetical protein [Candidatus Eisenbacteria bacterium]
MQQALFPATYGATFFDQFLAWEEIPVIKPEDLLETRFLRELKASGASASKR